ncbi:MULTISPECIES: response regulator [unclassified Pseudoalteromonas]|uniref:response regulator n=1 Tax=unclassified Pseudoalteromonas TaxID=194690 RepID=UPI000CF71C94|nr:MULTISPECIES: response regulator transcription factor [unclassified Pseudoalteromonas]
MTAIESLIMADDHELVRSGLKSLIQQQFPDVPVLETGSGDGALALILEQQPALALLDVTLPTMNGLDVVASARKAGFKGKVIMLSMHHWPKYVARAWLNGANGYVLKDSAFEELLVAINTVMKHERYLSKGICAQAVDDVLEYMDAEQEELLTPRQRQVLQLVAEGHSSKYIASELNVSLKTVEAHRSSIMNRLGIHDLAGLIKAAISLGLTELD